MEINLDFIYQTTKNNGTKGQAQIVNETSAHGQRVQATDVESNPAEVTRVVVLRCGTVMLQNYTPDLDEPGRQLMLIREPDNPYDRWATKVCTPAGTMLGYLPSWKNQSVARLMDAGKNITVFVDEALHIPEPSPAHYSPEDERLPLILYMDVQLPKER